MRNKIIELINKDFKNQKKSFFLTADLGYSVLEGTKKIYKKKFINVGVAENNMLLLACGINEISKNRVYVYSIASFLILRTLEVIRNYISHEKRNICLIGVGSGVSYSKMGKTHFNLDDLNILYSIKNILILNPSNNQELIYLFKKFKNYKYPIYFRINKNNFSNKFKLKRKKNIFQKKGNFSNLIISGAILNTILDLFSFDELDKLNVISVPIFSTKYSSNILKLLNKNQKTLLITDSSKTIFFEEIKNQILATSKIKSVKNFDLDHNKIKNVKDYNNLLGDMGVTKKKLYKYLF